MSDELNGTYRARAVEAALGKTKQGAEQVAILFEILDAEGMPGHRLTYFGSFSDAAVKHTLKALRSAGWTGSDLADLSSVAGNEVSLVIEQDEYEGKRRARIRWVNPPNTGGGIALKEQLDPAAAKSFAARMKGAVLAFDMEQGKPRATGRPHQPAEKKSPPKNGGVMAPEPPAHDPQDDEMPDWAR